MSEKEQRMLAQDSRDVHRKAQIAEIKLSTAIRKGIAEGKRREMKRRRVAYGAGVIAAAAASVFFTTSPLGAPSSEKTYEVVQTTTTQQPIDVELFRPMAKQDQGIAAALDQGLVKPINQSVEKDGFRIDVAGAFTDGRKSYIMYSAQNNTDHTAYPLIDSLAFGGVEASSFKAQSMQATSSSELLPGETGYYVYTASLEPAASYKEGATIGLKIWDAVSNEYRSRLKFTIPLEPDLLEEKDRIYHPRSTLVVDGQKINVSQVQFTPLNTYVDLEYDASNDQQIFKLLNPVLVGEKGEEREKVYYPDTMFSDDSKVTLVFRSNSFDHMDGVSLKVSGIAALPKEEMHIAIDLGQKQIVAAPDQYVQIIEPEEPAADGEILLYFKREKAMAAQSFGMSLEHNFTDAEGNKHDLLSPETIKQGGHSVSTTADSSIEDYYAVNFGKEALDYRQPLTIAIEQYWNPIMDSQSVELVSN
ncbi:DUF4179 domain-containing protein [Paenibacillus sp. JJ-223]|uniref:DUF4179 domain-containing protein n=1 Tax=Paenibacillus sp. JJ-223 TaxID=2905647 RepID=UPI001F26C028|nr:DUF4179 domain-containing protein [Paenibacillus sp. JJ-223]CAH1197156.1 hypothetical protein PAECIP111890_01157 [Paenibacillus sp. JJ-223]